MPILCSNKFNAYMLSFKVPVTSLYVLLILFPSVISVLVGKFINVHPTHHFPIVFEDRPSTWQKYEGWSLEECFYNFLLSVGLGCCDSLLETKDTLMSTLDAVEAAMKIYMKNEYNNSFIDPPYTVIPIRIGSSAALLNYFKGENTEQAARLFVERHIKGLVSSSDEMVKAISNQITVRSERVDKQLRVFKNLSADPILQSAPIMDEAGIEKWQNAVTLTVGVPSIMDIQMLHTSDLKLFPTFILNLWHNFVRREHMLPQIRLSGLDPVYLMPGVDSNALKITVLSQVMPANTPMLQDQLASCIAHLQVWREIVQNHLSYALLLEDDVDIIAPDFVAVLQRALREVPSGWSIIVLDYDVWNYWPDAEKRAMVPQKCVAALKEYQMHYPRKSIFKLDGICASGSVSGLLISWRGAEILIQHALPINWVAADVFMRNLTVRGEIAAYALINKPISNTRQVQSSEKRVGITIRYENNEILETYTFATDVPSCDTRICDVNIHLLGID